jgi:hypothetical protein
MATKQENILGNLITEKYSQLRAPNNGALKSDTFP